MTVVERDELRTDVEPLVRATHVTSGVSRGPVVTVSPRLWG